ncbi:MAG: hypothetical protein ABIA62_05045 [Candidatus Woesearchaeota archaeon]
MKPQYTIAIATLATCYACNDGPAEQPAPVVQKEKIECTDDRMRSLEAMLTAGGDTAQERLANIISISGNRTLDGEYTNRRRNMQGNFSASYDPNKGLKIHIESSTEESGKVSVAYKKEDCGYRLIKYAAESSDDTTRWEYVATDGNAAHKSEAEQLAESVTQNTIYSILSDAESERNKCRDLLRKIQGEHDSAGYLGTDCTANPEIPACQPALEAPAEKPDKQTKKRNKAHAKKKKRKVQQREQNPNSIPAEHVRTYRLGNW